MKLFVNTSNGRLAEPDAPDIAAILAVLQALEAEPLPQTPPVASKWRLAARSFSGDAA